MIDIMTIFGLVLGAGSIIIVMYWGGTSHLLWNRDAAMLVFGGTFASMLISTRFNTIAKLPRVLLMVFFHRETYETKRIISILVGFAEKAKKEGIQSLQEDMPKIKDQFLEDGIGMVIDGLSPELVRENLLKDITFIRSRHYHVSNVVRSMGTYSPIFGLLATLLGVVQVLKNISDPKSLGSSMSIAVTGTFYGIALANFVFLPISNKLDAYTDTELLMKEVMIEGILSIQAGDIPIIVNKKLQSFMAAKGRKMKGKNEVLAIPTE
ncbi:MAG: MotA/TolQ/ExbB proton channel family protein [Endomicrobiales bacterium]|nr:MotA/TolQ/ExbB proton channel family protein [Endomicrobiales bacterium]